MNDTSDSQQVNKTIEYYATTAGGDASPAAPPPDVIAAAWRSRARDLAEWTLDHLVNRTDVWGAYNPLEKRGQTYTKADGSVGVHGPSYTAHAADVGRRGRGLNFGDLVSHYIGNRVQFVIGLHTTAPDNTCRWGATESDIHGNDDPGDMPKIIHSANCSWFRRLVDHGICALLTDSNGKGGEHLRFLLDTPTPSELVYTFLQWLTHDYASFGMVKRPELFPKQLRLDPVTCPFGNWLRLPGRHHTRDHWSRVWDGEKWLEGHAAIDFVLALEPSSPDLLRQAMPADWCEPAPAAKRVVVSVPATVPATEPRITTPASSPSSYREPADDFTVYRAFAWTEKHPVSVEGGRPISGSDTCMSLIRDLHTGFCLSVPQIWQVLRDWNARCEPPWSTSELAHKIASVAGTPDPFGRRDGYLRDADRRERQTSPVHAVGDDGASTFDGVAVPEYIEPRHRQRYAEIWRNAAIPADLPEGYRDAYRDYTAETAVVPPLTPGQRQDMVNEWDDMIHRARQMFLNQAQAEDIRLIPIPSPEQRAADGAARRVFSDCKQIADRMMAAQGQRLDGCGETARLFEDAVCRGWGAIGRHSCGRYRCPYCRAWLTASWVRHVGHVLLFDVPIDPANPRQARPACLAPVYFRVVPWREWKAVRRSIRQASDSRPTILHVRMLDDNLAVVADVPFPGATAISRLDAANRMIRILENARPAKGYVVAKGRWAKPPRLARYRDRGPVEDVDAARQIINEAGGTTTALPDQDCGGLFSGFKWRTLTPAAVHYLRPWLEDGIMPPPDVLASCRGAAPMPAWVRGESGTGEIRFRVRSREPDLVGTQ